MLRKTFRKTNVSKRPRWS